jgi:hypothetical protein
MTPPERDRPGGHQHDLLTLSPQSHHVFDERFEPGAIETPRFAIDEQRRTHLDHDAAGTNQRRWTGGLCSGRHDAAASTRGTIEETRSKVPVSRDNEPVKGQWYENVEDEETFRVLSVDEDSEMVEIEYLDGEIEELDLEEWREFDLELIEEPEGWSEEDDEDEDEDEDEDYDDEDEDEDDDWDEDEDEDYDDDGRER